MSELTFGDMEVALQDVYSFLCGNWRLTRTLDGAAFFDGLATFRPEDDKKFLWYHEEGNATFPNGFTAASYKDYFFSIENPGFSVYFDHDRVNLFNQIKLANHENLFTGSDVHLCGDDTYRSKYTFYELDHWRWEHRVTGPKKDFILVADYLRTTNGQSCP